MTSNLSLMSSMHGIKLLRWIPFLYNPSGDDLIKMLNRKLVDRRYLTYLEVITNTTP